jgi:hypothetical protein
MARCGFIKNVPCPENIKWKNVHGIPKWDKFLLKMSYI